MKTDTADVLTKKEETIIFQKRNRTKTLLKYMKD